MSYVLKRIEDCKTGDILDMGVFEAIDPRTRKQGPNTLNVRLAEKDDMGNNYHYTETQGAKVRVWRSFAARRR